MKQTNHLMLLHNGGLRSLVASALLLAEDPSPRLTFLNIDDGRETRRIRRQHVRRQAEAFGVTRMTELSMPHLLGHGYGRAPDGEPLGMLTRPQILFAALAEARYQQAEAVIWPVSVNADGHQGAQATEQVVLCQHLAEAEAEQQPRIETPLIEMNDQQVIELGSQLGVDWKLAWTCTRPGDLPCMACAGCRRRAQAFDQAGVIDTQIERADTSR